MNKPTRIVTNAELQSYVPMVESYIRKNVVKNWREANMSKKSDEVMLGNTGMSLADIRQHLMMEVVVALQKYNPNYRTPEGLSVKESTFVFTHIFNRGGQMLKKITKLRQGYGLWMNQIEQVLGDLNDAE